MHYFLQISESLVATQSNGLVIRESTFSTVYDFPTLDRFDVVGARSILTAPTLVGAMRATNHEMQQGASEKTRTVDTRQWRQKCLL